MDLSDEFINKVKRYNPFRTWGNLNHKVDDKKPLDYITMNAIRFHQMQYGDSIFVPMPRKYWSKAMWKIKGNTALIEQYALKMRWYRIDPVCGFTGLRIWCFLNKPVFKRPKMAFMPPSHGDRDLELYIN